MAPQRTPPARPSRAPAGRAAAGSPIRSSVRGVDAGLARMKLEQEKAEARKEANKITGGQPFRFFVPVGESRQVVIIDEAPEWFRTEHALKNPRTQRFDLFTPCIDEVANCPVCAATSKPGYFALYLTVLDLTPFTTGDGEEVLWSKKLMVVKLTQQKKIARLYEKYNSLRGMIIECTRDDDKSAAIGNDFEFVDWMEEAELQEYYNEYTDKEKKVHQVYGDEAFNYDEIFPDLTEEQLETIVGGGNSSVGNRRADARELSRPTNDRRPVRNTRRDEAPAEEPASRPARTARAAREEPAPRTAARRPVRDEAPAEEPAQRRAPARRSAPVAEEQDPPQRVARTATRPAATAAPAVARRPVRRAPAEDSPLPDDDAPAPAPDRAARRANLRGAR